MKVCHFEPRTRIPIFPEKYLYKLKINYPILNLAWHLPNEVRKILKKNNFFGRIIDVRKFKRLF